MRLFSLRTPKDHERGRILSAVVIPVSILTSMLYMNLLTQMIAQIHSTEINSGGMGHVPSTG